MFRVGPIGVPWIFFTGEFQIEPGSDGSPSVGEFMPPGRTPRGSGVTSDGERVMSADASSIFSCSVKGVGDGGVGVGVGGVSSSSSS